MTIITILAFILSPDQKLIQLVAQLQKVFAHHKGLLTLDCEGINFIHYQSLALTI